MSSLILRKAFICNHGDIPEFNFSHCKMIFLCSGYDFRSALTNQLVCLAAWKQSSPSPREAHVSWFVPWVVTPILFFKLFISDSSFVRKSKIFYPTVCGKEWAQERLRTDHELSRGLLFHDQRLSLHPAKQRWQICFLRRSHKWLISIKPWQLFSTPRHLKLKEKTTQPGIKKKP